MKMDNNRFKFRGWFSKYKRMHYVGDWYLKIVYFDDKPWNDPTTFVMQYTGVKDKNGKEIYEGDILFSHANEKPCNYIVKWADDRSEYCGFVLNPVMKNPPRVTFHTHNFKIWMAEGFEIIGNIFENPELLVEKS